MTEEHLPVEAEQGACAFVLMACIGVWPFHISYKIWNQESDFVHKGVNFVHKFPEVVHKTQKVR
ncbi:hypothetical protein ACE1TI_21225 [Alteribacillus sp. JSM 102045]|uniref:hypothetical protein n=1 Tax=Alteribacillus sp. JSM 102045 TaxID=1562101 RepID=UPI0035BED110